MIYQSSKIFYPSLAVILLLGGGCASIQQTKRTDDLENEVTALKSALKAKELQVNRLRQVLDDEQKQLRDLHDKLKDCMKEPTDLRKNLPNLK